MLIEILPNILLLSVLLISFNLLAVPARPGSKIVTQADGSTLKVCLNGDEWYNWMTTEDGYRIVPNSEGIYEYAAYLKSGIIVPTGIKVNDLKSRTKEEYVFLGSVPKNIGISKQGFIESRKKVKSANLLKSTNRINNGFPKSGARSYLLILANFSNTTATYSQADFNDFMNKVNYNSTGSFRDFYLENSSKANPLDITTTVTQWVTLPYTKEYYSPENKWNQFAYDAIKAASEAGVDLSQFDNNFDGIVDGIAIIHQGAGQEVTMDLNDIWSHSNSLEETYSSLQRTFNGVLVDEFTVQPELLDRDGDINTIGVICHEFGHALGAPDFYDADNEKNELFDGTGNWDCMANGCYNGVWVDGKIRKGEYPAHFNPYLKVRFGWMGVNTINTPQQIILEPTNSIQTVTKITTSTDGEYFLLENKRQMGFDVGIPGEGLLIYHVDENHIQANWDDNAVNIGSHQGMYPIAAAGYVNSSTCTYPTSRNSEFTDISDPASLDWAKNTTNKSVTDIVKNGNNIVFDFMALQNGSPQSLELSVMAYNQIDVRWMSSIDSSPILLVWNTSNNFGIPEDGTIYNAGDAISGGGTVLYYGEEELSFAHLNLTEQSTYFYRIWAYTNDEYSISLGKNATTFLKPIDSYPWNDGFESGIGNWIQEEVSGTLLQWYMQNGAEGSEIEAASPAKAQEGAANAIFFEENKGKSTRLISPEFIASEGKAYRFSFYHAQTVWEEDQDSLKVFYRLSDSEQWIELASYTENISDWTLESFGLNPGANFYLAFEAFANYGHGVVLDNVLVEEIQAETHLVEFVVSSGKSPIVGASVSFNGKVLVTDETGLVQFSDVLTGSKMPYVVIKDGYGEFDDYIDVEADVNHQVELDITNIEEGESVQFKVFPNPTKGSISVNVPILKFATYELYSLSGSLVRTGVLLDVENDLDLSSLSSGSYLLRVYYEQKVENVKVILQK